MKIKYIFFYISILTIISFVVSCTEIRVTHSWKALEAGPNKFNKILVVGLLNNSERELRQQMENHLQGDLEELGFTAVTSIREYGPKSFENMKEDDVMNKIENGGIDAILSVVLLDRQRERYYVPGRVFYSPYYMRYNHFWGYYGVMYDRIYSPGYYQTSTKYFWESNLYDLKTKKLLYSVQTESFDSDAASRLAHQYGKKIISDLEKQGVLIK